MRYSVITSLVSYLLSVTSGQWENSCNHKRFHVYGFGIEPITFQNQSNQYVLRVHANILVDDQYLFESEINSINFCIHINKDEFCNLDVFAEHEFRFQNEISSNVTVSGVLCDKNNFCFCSSSKNVVLNLTNSTNTTRDNIYSIDIDTNQLSSSIALDHDSPKLFEILSPYNNQKLVTNAVLILIQIQENLFELSKDGMICIERIYVSTLKTTVTCYNSYPKCEISPVNSTFIQLYSFDTGLWILNINAVAYNGSIIYNKNTTFEIINPNKFINYNYNNNNIQNDHTHIQQNIIADATFYVPNEEDMHMIRILEHQTDILLFMEANETHSGIPRNSSLIELQHDISTKNMEKNQVQEITFETFIYKAKLQHLWNETISSTSTSTSTATPIQQIESRIKSPKVISSYVGIYGDIQLDSMSKERVQRDSLIESLDYVERNLIESYPDMLLVADTDEVLSRKTMNILRKTTSSSTSTNIDDIHSPYSTTSNNYNNGINNNDNISSNSNGQDNSNNNNDPNNTDQLHRPFLIIMSSKHHLYDFNSIMTSEWGLSSQEGPYIASTELFTSNIHLHTASRLRRILRAEYRDSLLSVVRSANLLIWEDTGWHMSSFKNANTASDFRSKYPMERNPEFWTPKHCQLMMDIGVPHIMFQRGSSVHDMLHSNPLQYHDIQLQNLPYAVQINKKILERYSKMNQNYQNKSNILEYLVNEYNHLLPQNIDTTIGILHEADKRNRINKSKYFIFKCLQNSTPDVHDVYNQLCCVDCPFYYDPDACTFVLPYIETKCKMSRGISQVSLPVLLPD
eukprot:gene12023-25185_t